MLPSNWETRNEKTLHLHENWLLAKQGSLKKHVFPFLFDAYPALLSAASKTGNSMKRCKYHIYIYHIPTTIYTKNGAPKKIYFFCVFLWSGGTIFIYIYIIYICIFIYIYLYIYTNIQIFVSNPPFPVLKLRALKSPFLINGGAPVCNSSHSRYINIKAKWLPCKTFTYERATANTQGGRVGINNSCGESRHLPTLPPYEPARPFTRHTCSFYTHLWNKKLWHSCQSILVSNPPSPCWS